MAGIFINYRRSDSAAFAGRLFDKLQNHFGRSKVFRDVANIPVGSRFTTVIKERIQDIDALLVVIGSNWLKAVDEDGRPRLEQPDDLVAAEISAALSQDKLVIPVLIENQPMVSATDLPETLQDLANINAVSISDERFEHDVQRLILEIEKILPGKAAITRKRVSYTALAVTVIALIAYFLWPSPLPPRLPLVDIDLSKAKRLGKFGYIYRGDGLELSKPNRYKKRPVSDLAITENGVVLCPWTNSNQDVLEKGGGRFNHWLDETNGDEYLLFSTSDNSPISNDRTYSITLRNRLRNFFCHGQKVVIIRPDEIIEDTENLSSSPHAFVYMGPGVNITDADTIEERRSRLLLLEDGVALGPAHMIGRKIAAEGGGSFSHWHDGKENYLYFSTSNNTDPRTNGRLYAVTIRSQ